MLISQCTPKRQSVLDLSPRDSQKMVVGGTCPKLRPKANSCLFVVNGELASQACIEPYEKV